MHQILLIDQSAPIYIIWTICTNFILVEESAPIFII